VGHYVPVMHERNLAAVFVLATAMSLLTACSGDVGNGRIAGTVRLYGGAFETVDAAVPGSVTARSEDGRSVHAESTALSGLSIEVPAGTYTVTATSPKYIAPQECLTDRPAVVRGGHTTRVRVICFMR
jgi:hypothetical protein